MKTILPLITLTVLAGCASAPPALPIQDARHIAAAGDHAPGGDRVADTASLRQQLAVYQRSNEMLRQANEQLIGEAREMQATINALRAPDSRTVSVTEHESLRRELASVRQELSTLRASAQNPPALVRSNAGRDPEAEIALLRAAHEKTLSGGQQSQRATANTPRFEVMYRFSDAPRRDAFFTMLGNKGVSDRAKGSGNGEYFVYVGSFSSEVRALSYVRELERSLNIAGAVIVSR